MNWIDVAISALAAGWIGSGLAMFAWCVAKEGLPDHETYDGPAISWGETSDLVIACVLGGPIWWIIYVAAKRS